jgi:hypothetical protein
MLALAHLANLCQSITDRGCRVHSVCGVEYALVGQVLICLRDMVNGGTRLGTT